MASLIAVTIDNGSTTCRAGLTGEYSPRISFPSVVGRLRMHGFPADGKEIYVGQDAKDNRGILTVKHPVEFGMITNWDDMEELWNYTFSQLRARPSDHSLLITETVPNPKPNREKLVQVMFETFNVPALFVAARPALSLFESGRTTGIVLSCGGSNTSAVPIYEGHALPHAVFRPLFGGSFLTHHLSKLLGQSQTIEELERAQEMKEKFSYVAWDFDQEMKIAETSPSSIERSFTLPDGKTISLSKERFMCMEGLFQPHLLGIEGKGIAHHLLRTIQKCDPDLQDELYRNIVLSGGTTLSPGFVERIQKEIEILAPPGTQVKVIAPPEREYSAWVGGSVLSSLPPFSQMCISAEQYDESGPAVVHRTCF